MEPERWTRVKELLNAALEVDADARAAFLDAACGEEELRREVESLLASPSLPDGFLDGPAWKDAPPPAPDESLQFAADEAGAIGRTLGQYEIVEKIGQGGMGVVYKARDPRLGRFVAVKILPREQLADSRRRARFVVEARAASALNHPNIVTVHGIASEGGTDFLAMEYVEGTTLDRLIPRKGMPLNEALKVAIQVADALSAAHAAGIVHRDVKPANVMVTASGLVKVLDFGLAKLTDAAAGVEAGAGQAPPITEEGRIAGTAAYMSPEQAEGRTVDARSDIFSFGSVLYEMLTGRRAFQGDSTASTLAAVLREEPLPLADQIPHDLKRVVARCLRKDPNRRFQHVKDLLVELEELKEESDSGKPAGVAAPAPPRHRVRWRRFVVAAAVAGLALAAVVAWRLRMSKPPDDLRAVQLTSYSGSEAWPSFSPDGRRVAFQWNGDKEDNSDIYVTQVGAAGPPLRLTTNPSEEFGPAWSPDDRWIAFGRRQGEGKIVILLVPPLGGPERLVAEVFSESAPWWASSLAWTPDARWLVFSAQEPRHAHRSIWAVSVDTGERRRLTTFTARFPDAVGDHSPSISPDGRFLAFARVTGSYVVELDVLRLTSDFRPEGEPVRMTDQRYATVLGIAWTADSREVVYGAGGAQSQSLWRLAVAGTRPPKRMAFALPAAVFPAIAAAQPRLVYTWWLPNMNLWRADTRTGERRALIGTSYEARSPQYSPDGRKIAFNSNRSGNLEVWTCDADGSNCQQLTSFNGPQSGSPRWSPDGRWLALDSRAEGQSEVYVIPAEGGWPRRMTYHPATDAIPSWSGDGRWIYFASDRSGRLEIWKLPKEGGEPVQVTHNRGHFSWQPPGARYLYYTKGSDPGGLFKMPVEGGEETEIPEVRVTVSAAAAGAYFSRAVTPRGIYFMVDPDRIQFLDFATNQVTTVATLDRPGYTAITATPDGAHVVWVQPDRSTLDLMLVENFR